jgi:hypothetical protein
MINELQAVAIATRFLVGEVPDAEFHEVWAARDGGRWLISFGKVFADGVVECPGGWAVSVDMKSGKPKWFPAL